MYGFGICPNVNDLVYVNVRFRCLSRNTMTLIYVCEGMVSGFVPEVTEGVILCELMFRYLSRESVKLVCM
jgi:hypothetical protein